MLATRCKKYLWHFSQADLQARPQPIPFAIGTLTTERARGGSLFTLPALHIVLDSQVGCGSHVRHMNGTTAHIRMIAFSTLFGGAMKADELKNEAPVLYSSSGPVLKKTYAELGAPRPYRKDEVGPVGDFWRIWRGDATRKGEVVSIAVEGREKHFEIDFSKLSDGVPSQPEGDGNAK